MLNIAFSLPAYSIPVYWVGVVCLSIIAVAIGIVFIKDGYTSIEYVEFEDLIPLPAGLAIAFVWPLAVIILLAFLAFAALIGALFCVIAAIELLYVRYRQAMNQPTPSPE